MEPNHGYTEIIHPAPTIVNRPLQNNKRPKTSGLSDSFNEELQQRGIKQENVLHSDDKAIEEITSQSNSCLWPINHNDILLEQHYPIRDVVTLKIPFNSQLPYSTDWYNNYPSGPLFPQHLLPVLEPDPCINQKPIKKSTKRLEENSYESKTDEKHREERFKRKFVKLVDQLHQGPLGSTLIETQSCRPKNQDAQHYTDTQLEELAKSIRAKLRRINIEKRDTPDIFLKMLEKIVETSEKYGYDNSRLYNDEALQQLRNQPCFASKISEDGRVQIPRFAPGGKEKKVYLSWDLYILFNFVDENRKKPNEVCMVKNQMLFQKYCKYTNDDQNTHSRQWLCFHPLHYSMTRFEDVSFHKEVEKHVVAAFPSLLQNDNERKEFEKWINKLQKSFLNGPNSSADDFYNIVHDRLPLPTTDGSSINHLSDGFSQITLKENNTKVVGKCCFVKAKKAGETNKTSYTKDLYEGVIKYIRPELESIFKKLPDHKKDTILQCKNSLCINPNHFGGYQTNQELKKDLKNEQVREQSKSAKYKPKFDKWGEIKFHRFAKTNSIGRNFDETNIHDEMRCFFPVEDANHIGAADANRKILNNMNIEDKSILSLIKIDPYSKTPHENQNKKRDVYLPCFSFNLSSKDFYDKKRCMKLYQQKQTHAACVQAKRGQYCKNSYIEGGNPWIRIPILKKTKPFGFDVSMWMDKELSQNLENIYSQPFFPDIGYDIYVRNTGHGDIYYSLSYIDKFHLWRDNRNQIENFDTDIFKRLKKKDFVRVLSYNEQTKKSITEVVLKNYEAENYPDNGTDLLSRANDRTSENRYKYKDLNKYALCKVLLPWNTNGKEDILKLRLIENLPDEYFYLCDSVTLNELEYVSITCIKTTFFIEQRKGEFHLDNTGSGGA